MSKTWVVFSFLALASVAQAAEPAKVRQGKPRPVVAVDRVFKIDLNDCEANWKEYGCVVTLLPDRPGELAINLNSAIGSTSSLVIGEITMESGKQLKMNIYSLVNGYVINGQESGIAFKEVRAGLEKLIAANLKNSEIRSLVFTTSVK